MKYVRIRYLTHGGTGMPLFDSYVLACQDTQTFQHTLDSLRSFGFSMEASRSRFPDPEERIMPGAIMSVTPCNERGWSDHDIKRERERREAMR